MEVEIQIADREIGVPRDRRLRTGKIAYATQAARLACGASQRYIKGSSWEVDDAGFG
jgi:hypothetical protein